MRKGAIAVLVSVWVSVAGTGIGLAALISASTGRLDTQISQVDARLSGQIAELAKGQTDLRKRMAKVEAKVEAIPGQIAELTSQIAELGKGQTDLRERMAKVEAKVEAIPGQIAELTSQIAELGKGQAELGERMTRVETILGEVRDLAAVQESEGGMPADGTTAQGSGAARSLQ